MRRPVVSVIMAAHNVAPYLEAAIRSVLAQRGVAFELLVGDDGSTDGTWAVLQRYRAESRVRAWRWRHRGAGATRNRLIARARGRYLAICDADDLVLPGHLRRLSHALDQAPSIGVVYGNIRRVRGAGGLAQLLPRSRLMRRRVSRTWHAFGWTLGHQGTMIRKLLLQRSGGYRADLPFMEDTDLFVRLSERTQFLAVRGCSYLYRRRPGTLSTRYRQARRSVALDILRTSIRRRYGYRVPW